MCGMQFVAAKAVPVTEVVTEDHMKPFIKTHADEIETGTKAFTEEQLLPAAEQIREHLPEVTEQFTEDTLKPAAKELSKQIEHQVGGFYLCDILGASAVSAGTRHRQPAATLLLLGVRLC